VSAAGGAISLLLGAVLLRLSVTDDYQRYVRAGLGPYLVLAGIVVVGLGLVTLVQALRHEPLADDLDEDHGDGGIGVGWLLLAPIAALLLVAPPTLGSYGVDRGATVNVRAGAPVFDPLKQGRAPLALSLFEFGQRTFDHGGASFNGVPCAADRLRRGRRRRRFPARAVPDRVLRGGRRARRRACRRRGGRVAREGPVDSRDRPLSAARR
jgi:hypothetical protein